ncbi:hypothetical protein BJ742DRAFT_427236 [Cladochytrium replicatum]|nr:hypothetical protein BJ742DRAFT_427236 [Cladochytrium replicatum]
MLNFVSFQHTDVLYCTVSYKIIADLVHSMRVHRSVGPSERWQLQLHEDRLYSCVAWGVRYKPTSPTAHTNESTVISLTKACAQLLDLHPRLRLGVAAQNSPPFFVILPASTAIPFRVESDHCSLGELVNAQMSVYFDISGKSEYLWRISVSFDTKTAEINIVLAAHHMILDGLSGMQVLLDFLRLLSVGSVDALIETYPVVRTDLADDLPLEEVARIVKPNIFFHLPAILGEIFFPKLHAILSPRLWSPLHEDPSVDLSHSSRLLPRPFNKNEIRGELLRVIRCPETAPPTRAINFVIPNKSNLLRLARNHRATMHTALLTATLDATAAAYSLGPSATLGSETPTCLRPDCNPPVSSRPFALGTYAAGIDITGHPNPLPQNGSEHIIYRSHFWDNARRKKEELRVARPLGAQRNGLISWIPDKSWGTYFRSEEKVDAPRLAFELSNLMEWDLPEKLRIGGSMAFGFEEVSWSQPMFMGPLVMVSVVSCKHTDVVYCTISYKVIAGVRDAEINQIREHLLHLLAIIGREELI